MPDIWTPSDGLLTVPITNDPPRRDVAEPLPADGVLAEQAAVVLEQLEDRETTTGEFSGACSDDAEILDAGDDQTLPNNI